MSFPPGWYNFKKKDSIPGPGWYESFKKDPILGPPGWYEKSKNLNTRIWLV
jgi:hypothetical protein